MKIGELTDTSIEEPKSPVVIELSNGQRISTNDYYHCSDKAGNPVIVIKAGRKLTK